MKLSLSRRVFALLLAAALPFAVGAETYGYHECPHHHAAADDRAAGHTEDSPEHGGTQPAVVHATMAAASDSRDADHGRAASQGSGDNVAPAALATATRHDGGKHSGPCTCVGTCHGSAAAPLPTIPDTGLRLTAAIRAPGIDAAHETLPRRHAYLLPFANAPPLIG